MHKHHALELYDNGWNPIPLPKNKKKNPPAGLTGANGQDLTKEQIEDESWDNYPKSWNGNIGTRAPEGVIGIDIDNYGHKLGYQNFLSFLAIDELPPTWTSSGRDLPSGIYWYKAPKNKFQSNPCSGVEIIQRHHRYALVYPSVVNDQDANRKYIWRTPEGNYSENPPTIDELAELPVEWIPHLEDKSLWIEGQAITSEQGRNETVSRIAYREAPNHETIKSLTQWMLTNVYPFVDQSESPYTEQELRDSCRTAFNKTRTQQINFASVGVPTNDKGKPIWLVEAYYDILIKRVPIASQGGKLWTYQDGVYRKDDTPFFKALTNLAKEVGLAYRQAYWDELLRYSVKQAPELDLSQDKRREYTGFLNGDLDQELNLHPHDPERQIIYQIPYNWNPNPQLKTKAEAWMDDRLYADDKKWLLTLLGIGIIGYYPPRTAAMLIGRTGTGKSTLMRLFETAVGRESVCHINPQQLANSNNKFVLSPLVGKVLNTGHETDDYGLMSPAQLKTVLGGDLLQTEYKGKDPFNFRSWAVHIFSGQTPPRTSDHTEAFYRRLTLISMDRQTSDEEDSGYLEKLVTTQSMEWLISESVKLAVSSIKDGMPDISAPSSLLCGEYRRDELTEWIQDNVIYRENSRVEISQLLRTIRSDFSKQKLGRLPSTKELKHRVLDLVAEILPDEGKPPVILTKTGNRPGWQNLSVRNQGEDHDMRIKM